MSEVTRLTARDLVAGYARRELSPVEVVDALLARIETVEPAVHAFTTVTAERAREAARAAERAYGEGTARPLEGVPLGVKDLFDSAGVRTTYGSPMFDDHVPDADAESLRRALAAGAILIGKTATHEFAWGITSVNFHQGSPSNPWARERMSGGSSGGSAVALAALECPLTLGSDTGGSIRMPASFCGIVGHKPTYGRVSRAGIFPLAASLDHPGPMARTPADAALLLAAIAGLDEGDPATEDRPLGDLDAELARGLAGLRVAVCPDLHVFRLFPDVQAVFDAAVGAVEEAGATVVETRFPGADRIFDTFGHIQRAEALYTHTQAGLFPARRDEYGADVLSRLELATRETVPDYLAAAAERQRIRAGFRAIFAQADVLLTPVSGGPPLPIGEEELDVDGHVVSLREFAMGYTTPQDLAGLPTTVVRAGFDELGIPVGVQLTAGPWQEALSLRAAQGLFDATPDIQSRWPELP